MRRRLLRTVLALVLVAGYASLLSVVDDDPVSRAAAALTLDDAAAQYVRLALELDRVRPGEVDSYFGPAWLRPSAAMRPEDPARLGARARELRATVAVLDDADAVRRARLAGHLESLAARLDAAVAPGSPNLLEEARTLYGFPITPPDGAVVEQARTALERLLPELGPLHLRVRALREALVIPRERRDEVFSRALAACRDATRSHWALPSHEALAVQWDGSAGAAWHRYDGRGRSRLLVNPAAVATIDSAIDVACHEGYPGHHAQFLLLGEHERLPVEERIVLLRSPASVLREGAAQYGVGLAFPPAARLAVERDLLAPLAGVARAAVVRHHEARPHLRVMERLVPGILSAWHGGLIDDVAASQRLEQEAFVTSPDALMRFTREHGAYVLAYTAVRDRVAEVVAIERQKTGRREWDLVRDLIAPPRPEALSTRAEAISGRAR
jgi:hypothetical protein